MDSLGQLLEEELSEAVEVKNPKSFHRFILLLTENLVEKKKHEEVTNGIRSDLKEVIAIMRERFDAVDKRFESVDKRFEDVNNRFNDMNKRFSGLQWMMGIGFTILAIMMSLFQYI